jgi:dGTPase
MKWSKVLSKKRVGELQGKEPSEHDARTPFERDYGRAVFSTPLRRLQDKTQVFPLEEHDAVRTRLTHSLEVSSVARTLGHEAGNWIVKHHKKEIAQEQVHAIETIAATCGLLHDLGNPPFGHAGESAIRSWFANRLKSEEILRAHGDLDAREGIFGELETKEDHQRRIQYENDFLKWEGNAQTLRLVSRLQVLADYHGINLTCGTFSAACKYVARSSEVDSSKKIHEKSKPGFFASEEETTMRVAAETGTGGARNPITFLVEASDDIVYSTGDLEDGVRKGIFNWEFLKGELRSSAKADILLEKSIKDAERKVDYKRSPRVVANNEEVAQAFRTFSIHAMKEEVFKTFCHRYDAIMDGDYHCELAKDPDCRAARFISACKMVGQNHVYPSKNTLKLELMGRKVIHDLMDVFWEGAQVCGTKSAPPECKAGFEGKAFGLISKNYRKVFTKALEEGKLPERYCRLQLVTDQIAGMTDTFATTLHKRLMNG